MPQVLNVRHLPGFRERRPVLPPGAIYIGRAVCWYRLRASKLKNPFGLTTEDDRETIIAYSSDGCGSNLTYCNGCAARTQRPRSPLLVRAGLMPWQ
jgi:hypothetical protein